MVYIASWQEFQQAAEDLYARSPHKTRYCVKWRSSQGKLVLKITDDTTCLKFKTYSSIFLNRFEALNLSLMRRMQNPRPEAPSVEQPLQFAGEETVPMPITQGTPVTGGGVKKKKPKKRK